MVLDPMIDRGPTWTEAHRHACEVRYVMGMPTRDQRAGFLDGVERRRGKPAADRLRDDVATAWRARRETPSPRDEGPRAATVGAPV